MIAPHTGAFVEFEYDGVAKQPQVGNVDIRHVREGQLFGQDVLWGLTGNNNPTVQDAWNSTPAWGFPYNGSALAPAPHSRHPRRWRARPARWRTWRLCTLE